MDASNQEYADIDEEYLKPGEVAAIFRVDPKTVGRWATSGKVAFVKTIGGHRRYRKSDIHSLLKLERGSNDEA